MPISRISSRSGAIIVVTGGIASGKSSLCNLFRRYGFLIVDSDAIAWKGISCDLRSEILSEFHLETINKAALSNIVFASSPKLRKLEDIVHPFVYSEIDKIIADCIEYRRSVVIEIPLFFEAVKENVMCDIVLVTTASYETRKIRARMRKNMTDNKFDAIVARQLCDEYKVSSADMHICTEKSAASLKGVIKRVFKCRENDSRSRSGLRYRDNRIK